jgi:predicted RNA-binding Zn-ribbon protein involved in translation (DUF1610 family)
VGSQPGYEQLYVGTRAELVLLTLNDEDGLGGIGKKPVVVHPNRKPQAEERDDPGIVGRRRERDHRAERKAPRDERQAGMPFFEPIQRGPHILLLAESLVIASGAGPHAAEVETQGGDVHIRESLCGSEHGLRMHGPPLEGVGVTNDGRAPERAWRLPVSHFQMPMRRGDVHLGSPTLSRLVSRPGPTASLSLTPVPEMDFEDTTLGAGEFRRFGSSGTRIRPMVSNKSDDHKLADQANELYWRSGQSVNEIAETMDLSKSGLYALIRPLPAKRACPECGEGLVFPNRTTEQKTITSCPECGYEGEAPEPSSEARPPKKRAPRRTIRSAEPNGKGRSDLEAGSDPKTKSGATVPKTSGRSLKSNRVLWASVLLGVAAGLYVTRRSR